MGITSDFMGATGGRLGSRYGGKIGKAVAGKYGKMFGQVMGGLTGAVGGGVVGSMLPIIGSFKKGGRVKKTGAYILHKGEHVVPVRRRKRRR
jgi:hypothetical protein